MADPTYVPVVQNGGPLTPTTLTVSGASTFNGTAEFNDTANFGAAVTFDNTTTFTEPATFTNGVSANALDVTGSVITVGAGDYRLPGGDFGPQDHGLEAWTFDPYTGASGSAAVGGTLHLQKLMIRRAVTLDTIWWVVTTGATTPTAGQNFVGLYSSAGTLLASTGVDADSGSAGTKSTAITAQAVTAGFVWVGFLFNAATPPSMLRGNASGASAPNMGLAAAAYRSCTNGTGLTALPGSITPASNSQANNVSFFAGLAE